MLIKLAILVVCSSLVFGQSSDSTDQKSENSTPLNGHHYGNIEVLTDTQGVDFGPYFKMLLSDVRNNWYRLIPESAEMKKGKVAIDFAVMRDGHVRGLMVRASSGDPELDRPAYRSIITSDPFRPLPSKFTGPSLELRLRFYYNPEKTGLK